MDLLARLFDGDKKQTLFDTKGTKTLAQYQQELLNLAGRKQFEKLQDLGLSLPVQLGG